jgi:N-acetylglucosaminyldiphosphoundecaprenol N-acetyl-beta-D-mannosaminyltransferase
LNSHDLYQFAKEEIFRNSIKYKNDIKFIDGFIISLYLSLSNLTIAKRFRGPDFTEKFLKNMKFEKEKMLFIGLGKKDLDLLITKFPNLNKNNLFCYNPPFIKNLEFSNEEVEKMIKLINSKKIDFVWVSIGSPKQNILSNALIDKTQAHLFFNVGAAFDFLLDKKKRAPKFWQNLGIEWFYRFVTDFRYSRKKVLRSFVAIKFLTHTRLK